MLTAHKCSTDEIEKLAQVVETSESRREILRASARLQVLTATMLAHLTDQVAKHRQEHRMHGARLIELSAASAKQASELGKIRETLESTGLIYAPPFDPVITGIDTLDDQHGHPDDSAQDDEFDDPLIDPDVDPAYDAPASSLRADGSPFVEPDPQPAFPGTTDDDVPF